MPRPHDSDINRLSGPTLIAAVLTTFACSASSVLIRKDDQIYERSRQRLQRTGDLVEAEPAAKPEAPMFLQAEALYRYRFESPPRSLGGYLAEGAAAAFDFPALQSIAASLDLFDLRLKANDGAIQIWETLLVRYPRTPLRPLTFYRLGWAYRNKITAGFPRDDPNEPFQELSKNVSVRAHPLGEAARISHTRRGRRS